MSNRPNTSDGSTVPTPKPIPNEVRYSLPELLAELKLERTSGAFSLEKLHQVEIGKLFQNRKKRRGHASS